VIVTAPPARDDARTGRAPLATAGR
jgi:hypothetical protein